MVVSRGLLVWGAEELWVGRVLPPKVLGARSAGQLVCRGPASAAPGGWRVGEVGLVPGAAFLGNPCAGGVNDLHSNLHSKGASRPKTTVTPAGTRPEQWPETPESVTQNEPGLNHAAKWRCGRVQALAQKGLRVLGPLGQLRGHVAPGGAGPVQGP